MLDPKKLLDDLLGSKAPGSQSTVSDGVGKVTQLARDNPLATGAIAAVLLGTGAGRSITKSAVKVGGLAAIAGLAYKAYQNYQSGKAPEQPAAKAEPELLPPPAGDAFNPTTAPQGEENFALVLVRAMIAAARADGHIDETEKAKITERMGQAGMSAEAQDFIQKELATPVDIDALVNEAKTEAQKIELYTASRLAIEPETRAERGYLDLLAGRLRLPDALVDHIEATVSNAKV
ncbi:hypothetical protein ATN84_14155 [Paramesorhizobium deserti]|uniref:Protein YebE n=1 Tax=Paramesorhizobium deserti TaxID=1494590 RepID=A0A135HSC4_9HYPH|nr:tellurite resistance TerB family protein [Paramesorhizobium deserti]KXF76063.1 hypothetical protein ATN84_14155 [Paramesorhizobium deserti]